MIKICFWNVAGLVNKCEETWRYLENFDILGLTETWVEEERWQKLKENLPKEFEWWSIPAERESKKGRAKGGIIMAARRNKKEIKIEKVDKGIMEMKLELEGNSWRIFTIYSQKIDETMDRILERLQEEEELLLLGGDFNARTGNKGGPIREEKVNEKKEVRQSIDQETNGEGRKLISKIEDRGWTILNGSFGEEGGWTYIGECGSSVIDYVISNDRAIGEVKRVKEGIRTESDHLPLEVELIGKQETERRTKKRVIELERNDWTEEGISRYQENCRGWICKQHNVEGAWTEMREKIKNSLVRYKKKIIPWSLGKKSWYDKEWKKRKRELRKTLRDLRKRKINSEVYVTKRKAYREWCKEQKKKHEREEENKIRNIKSETEAWKYINKFRKKKAEKTDGNIQPNNWREHFMDLLEGTQESEKAESPVRENIKEEKEIEKVEETAEIKKEELIEWLKKLKKAKAPGEDGIQNEAWKHMSIEIGEEYWKLINRIWRGEGIPEDWKKGMISPIFKNGDRREVKNYRGITLIDTAYKIYANILNEKLGKEVEDKLKDTQFGFRKGRGTMDAIYLINCVVNRELSRKRGKIFAFFADLKAAFDKVLRGQLEETMKKIEIENNLRRRIMEIYKETFNVVKIGEKCSEGFWTRRGLRQGCPLSPTLFNIYIMDLEEEMKRGQVGGIVVGKEKFWTIMYADDIVLLAKSEAELKEMMKRFKKFLEKKGLILSPEKSKVLVFEKGKGAKRKREWKWEEEKLEEVRELRYLGYILQKNGRAEKQIKERMRKATIAMKRTWSIGERIFRDNFSRRMKAFDSLVGSVALYGAEVWGWQEEGRLDEIKRRYVKWILKLDRNTPNYMLIEETKMKELRIQAIRRAIKYEEKVNSSKKKLIKECIKNLERTRPRREEGGWEKKRRELLEKAGSNKERTRENREGEDKETTEKIMERIERKDKEDRIRKINESNYNKEFKRIRTEETPKYLKGNKKKKDRELIARFRCGNETKGRQYWTEGEDRRCRLCGGEEENLSHIIDECGATRNELTIEEFLEEEGRGLEEMKKIDRLRKDIVKETEKV